jgi:PAS domain S-box-containing protein
VFAGIMTKKGVLIEANWLSLEACGYRAEEALGRPFHETPWWRKFPESQEKIRAAIAPCARGIPYRETCMYSWAGGAERIMNFALHPIVDDRGEVIFLHPTGVDITDVKRAEEKYRKLSESLDAQVRARTSELEQGNTDVLQLRELRDDCCEPRTKSGATLPANSTTARVRR